MVVIAEFRMVVDRDSANPNRLTTKLIVHGNKIVAEKRELLFETHDSYDRAFDKVRDILKR